MSYCRWSSMDFRCDVYAYETVGDCWVIHLAGNRVVGKIPKTPPFPSGNANPEEVEAWAEAYTEASRVQLLFLETAVREEIGLPYAGETIYCHSLEHFLSKLMELREIGYVFPDDVLETLDDELAEPRMAST